MQFSRRSLCLLLALFEAITPGPILAHSVGSEMADAANTWLATLTPEQKPPLYLGRPKNYLTEIQ